MARLLTVRGALAFDRVFRDGRHVVKGDIALHYAANGMVLSRFAFVVPAKAGKAHERNTVRRRMREVVREALPMVTPGNDIVFIVRRVADTEYAGLRGTMRWLLASKGLLEGEE